MLVRFGCKIVLTNVGVWTPNKLSANSNSRAVDVKLNIGWRLPGCCIQIYPISEIICD